MRSRHETFRIALDGYSPTGDVVESFGDPRKYKDDLTYDKFPEISLEEHRANVRYIIRACNAHYELLEACKAAQRALRATSATEKDYSWECGLLRDAIHKATTGEI